MSNIQLRTLSDRLAPSAGSVPLWPILSSVARISLAAEARSAKEANRNSSGLEFRLTHRKQSPLPNSNRNKIAFSESRTLSDRLAVPVGSAPRWPILICPLKIRNHVNRLKINTLKISNLSLSRGGVDLRMRGEIGGREGADLGVDLVAAIGVRLAAGDTLHFDGVGGLHDVSDRRIKRPEEVKKDGTPTSGGFAVDDPIDVVGHAASFFRRKLRLRVSPRAAAV